MKNFLAMLAASAALVFAFPAAAGGWSGCYIGVSGGYGDTNTDADLTLPGASVGVESLSGDGARIGGLAGCDVVMSGRVLLGVWGDYLKLDDEEFDASATFGQLVNFSLDDQWSLGARAGYLVHETTLVYAFVGYTEADVSDLAIGAASFSLDTADGIVWGGGVEVALGSGWFLRGEYRYTDFDEQSVDIVPGFVSADLDMDQQQGLVGLTYKLPVFGSSTTTTPLK